jgi:hypothetical protein
MRHKTHFLHSVSGKTGMGFDPADYSRFKYGSKTMARSFGRALGDKLASILSIDKQYVIIPAPYNFIPTATFALKDYVLAELNRKMINDGMRAPIQESKIFRPASYNADYGNMTLEERRKAIGSEKFHTDKQFLKGKVALLLDDIRVTGAHEERVCEMIERLGIDGECAFVYFACVQGDYVDPKIENYLNYYAMKSLLDLDYIIKNEEFIFNTRNVKYILAAEHEEFKNFINYQKVKFRETLFVNALGNQYYKDLEFLKNINYLKSLL